MSGPHPSVALVRSAVRADLDAFLAGRAGGAGPAVSAVVAPGTDGPGDPGGEGRAPRVLVACSGGPDSLALAAAVAFVAPRRGVAAGAVVVDHGTQEGSAQVADRAADQCRSLGLDPVEVVRVRVGTAGGPEGAARTARYAALRDAAARTGAEAVLLGHTRDDQAESVLLALARGSGGRSLSGMAPVRGPLRRPLLGTSRATVHEACAALGLEPWLDPTNAGQDNRRAAVRNRVLPLLAEVLGPGVPEALARTAEQLRQDGAVLDSLAADLLRAARTAPAAPTALNAGRAEPAHDGGLAVAPLAAAPTAVRRRALRAALLAWGCPAGALASSHVRAVDALVTAWTGQGPAHVPGLVVTRRCGRLTSEISS